MFSFNEVMQVIKVKVIFIFSYLGQNDLSQMSFSKTKYQVSVLRSFGVLLSFFEFVSRKSTSLEITSTEPYLENLRQNEVTHKNADV